jgi:hypothetical protein
MLRPLGLPPGSVRALLLIGLGVRAILDLRTHHRIEPWLAVALLVSIAAYFSARSSAQGTAPQDPAAPKPSHPLWLPAGTIRAIVLLLVAYGAWLWYRHHSIDLEGARGEGAPGLLLGAFALGVVLRWALGKARRPEDVGTGLFWHLQALVALASVGGLIAIALGGLPADIPPWVEPMLAAVVVYYFGTR